MATPPHVEIEVFGAEGWVAAAKVTALEDPTKKGFRTPTRFEYLIDYAAGPKGKISVSLRFPVALDQLQLGAWPAFLLDLIPSGAARRFWMNKLSLGEGPHADWRLLETAAFNPPGRVRVKCPTLQPAENPRPAGFTKDDVVNRSPAFLYYIEEYGGPVKGATGAGGDAPKYLLREDALGKFHADLALPDAETRAFWLVKFPRGRRSPRDVEVLRGEAIYAHVARELGIRALSTPPVYCSLDSAEALFVPRIDLLRRQNTCFRFGLESLSSAAGIADWPVHVPMKDLVKAVVRHSTDPKAELVEFLCRDLAGQIFGNTDNHGRNTAFLVGMPGGDEAINPKERVCLSPIFDFAPMVLDPEGITRTARWHSERGGRCKLNDVVAESCDLFNRETAGAERLSEEELMRSVAPFLSRCDGALKHVFDAGHACPILLSYLKTEGVSQLETLRAQMQAALKEGG